MFHIQQSDFFIRPSLLNLIRWADFRISCERINIIRPLLFFSEAKKPVALKMEPKIISGTRATR